MSREQLYPNLLVITPEGISHRKEIISLLSESGLNVLKRHKMIISGGQVQKLIGKRDPMLSEWINLLTEGTSEIVLLEGKNPLPTLMRVCGQSIIPSECAPETIRARFTPKNAKLVGDAFWFRTPIYFSVQHHLNRTDLKTLGLREYIIKYKNGSNHSA